MVIDDPIFAASFMVQKGGNHQKLLDKYCQALMTDRVLIERSERRCGHFFAYDWHKGGCIWISNKCSFGTVTHECLHATYHVMRHMDIELNETSEEVFAYYQMWLVNQIMTKLFKWRLK